MSRCLDCKGGTPAPLWKRCVGCSMKKLRFLMSDGQATSGPLPRRFTQGDRVWVLPPVGKEGVVSRSRADLYTVKFGDGTRACVQANQMRDVKDEG